MDMKLAWRDEKDNMKGGRVTEGEEGLAQPWGLVAGRFLGPLSVEPRVPESLRWWGQLFPSQPGKQATEVE